MIGRFVKVFLRVGLIGALAASQALAAAPRKVTIGVGTAVLNLTYPWLMMPVALDWWKQQGLDVTVIPVSGSLQATQLLVAGTLDFAEINASTIIQANVTNNIPLRAIMENTVLDWSLVTLADNAIQKPADFKGATIGVLSLASSGTALLRAYLTANGLDPENDVQIVATGAGGPALQALKSGRVQGLMFWSSMNTFFENQGVKLRYFYPEEWRRMPDFSLATLQSRIDSDPELVKTIALGAARASALAMDSPDCVRRIHWAHFPDTRPSGAPDDATAVAWDMNSLAAQMSSMKSSLSANGGRLWGATTPAGFDKVQQFMLQTKQIATTLPPATFVISTPNFFEAINDFDHEAIAKLAQSCPAP
ncbi:ABC transporter substrate-binding protein [Methylocapsa sp. S129]|uniref:ABC transporter substrate-binding protein n=1 Tax=Methylocapsa sp. S129 TaxID=1641869 RepID=UPI00131BAB5E|nr:ABC transporter substrate-binding protein [Methylocapsa sp. S129]